MSMIMLYPAPLLTITLAATSERTSHPVEFLLEETPRLRWSAVDDTVASASVAVSCAQAVSSLVVTGAVCADCAVTVGGGTPPGHAKLTTTDSYTGKKSFWFTFTPVYSLPLVVMFTRSGAKTISAEQLLVGATGEYTGVQYPVAEGLVDSSVITTMSDGTMHVRKRAAARTFAATLRATSAVCRSFLQTSRGVGRSATMFNLCTTVDADKWMVYGRFSSLPQGTHDLPTLSVVQFAIEEAL